jgi:hypothetical protein
MIKLSRSEYETPFGLRGEELKNGFAKRFGGGFISTSDLIESFKPDTDKMMKSAVSTDTKMINEIISSALDERLGETPQSVEEPTYSKPEASSYETTQMPFSFSNFEDLQEAMRRTFNSGAQDPAMQNAAAALSTTDTGTLAGLDFNVDEEQLLSPEQQESIVEPIVNTLTEQPSYINEKFNETLDSIYDEIEEIKVVGKTQDETLDDIFDEIEDINVIGKRQDDNIDSISEEIDSIDVDGLTDEEDIEDILVEGRQKDESYCKKVSQDVKQLKEETINERESDDPWERFKRLYADFYGGENAGDILREVKSRENMYDSGSREYGNSADLEESSMNSMRMDTKDILNAKKEKDDLDAFSEMFDDFKQSSEENKNSTPVIINNNRTITTRSNDSKTAKVFGDENTFNRLSIADSNHPQYMGYGR